MAQIRNVQEVAGSPAFLPSFFRILPPPLSILRPSPAFDPGLPVPLFSDRTCPSCLSLSLLLGGGRARGRYGRRGRSRRPCVRNREGGQRASERASDKDDDTRKTNSLPPSFPLELPPPSPDRLFEWGEKWWKLAATAADVARGGARSPSSHFILRFKMFEDGPRSGNEEQRRRP